MVENSVGCVSDESGNRTAREGERERERERREKRKKEGSFRVVHARLPLGHRKKMRVEREREKPEKRKEFLLVSAFHARKNDYSNVNRKANRKSMCRS